MAFSPLVDELVESLRCLPGVGQKTAQRMAFHLLERGRSGGTRLSDALSQAMNGARTLPTPKFAVSVKIPSGAPVPCVWWKVPRIFWRLSRLVTTAAVISS